MDKAYMLILGYRLDHSVDLTSVAKTVTQVKEDLIMLRAYASLSPEAHLVVWTSALDTRSLVELRDRIRREYSSMVESLVWLSVYKASPYVNSTIDVLGNLKQEPLRYLVAYPMKKDPEWYLMPFEERRSIMAEHIGIARSHRYSKNVRSYTTYAFGIASYEFLVVYEVQSLYEWVEVVERLREAKARKWVAVEEPVLVGELIAGW
jgi:chlorite dismutase